MPAIGGARATSVVATADHCARQPPRDGHGAARRHDELALCGGGHTLTHVSALHAQLPSNQPSSHAQLPSPDAPSAHAPWPEHGEAAPPGHVPEQSAPKRPAAQAQLRVATV